MSLKAIREYGVAATIKFSIFEEDGIDFRVDAAHASGDTKISKDEGAEVNTTNGFVDEGTGYSILLTAAEMTAARIEVFVVDQTDPKVWLDKVLIIETYGNPAAQHEQNFNQSLGDGVWDEEIVAAHQTTNSAAFILSNLFKGKIKLLSGTASSTNNTVVLASASAETVDDVYKFSLISTHDDFPGQTRLIVGYVGSTKTVTVFPDWTTNPGTSNGVGTSLIILAAGVSPASVEAILRTFITESSPGRIGGNFEFFYDNSDNQTAKKVDDVGTSFLTGPKDFFAASQTETDITVISGGFADTAAAGGDAFIFAHSGTDLDLRLNFNVGSNIKMTSFQVLAGLDTNGNRTATIELFDFGGAQFDVFDIMTNSSSQLDFFSHGNVDPKYTDTNGDVIIRFKSVDLQSGNRINVDLSKVTAVVDAGEIPSSAEIAEDVWRLGDTLHGKGPYRGNALAFTEVDTVISPTEVVLNSGPSQDITQSGVIALFTDQDDPNTIGLGKVVSWTAATLTLIIENAVGFTVVAGDSVDMFLSSSTVDLKDGDVNKKIIAQAIKEFDASTLTIDSGSLLKEIFDHVFGVNIIQVDGLTSADGNSFNFAFQAMAAMACGNFSLDTPVDGQTTFFKTDKITPLFIVETTDVIRNRIS